MELIIKEIIKEKINNSLNELMDNPTKLSFSKQAIDTVAAEKDGYTTGYYTINTEPEVLVSLTTDPIKVGEGNLDVSFGTQSPKKGETEYNLTDSGLKHMFDVLYTITFIVEDYIKNIKDTYGKNHEINNIVYFSSNYKNKPMDGNKNKGYEQREKLYSYFLKKLYPNAKIGKQNIQGYDHTSVGLGNNLINMMNEAKQVGTVYHFTTPENFKDIIKTDRIIGFTDSMPYTSPTKGPRRQTRQHTGVRGVSLTRNKDFYKDKNYNLLGLAFQGPSQATIRIALNGDKLSQRYKIIPFRYFYDFSKGDKSYGFTADESESRVITNYISNISKYIIAVDDVSKSTPVPISWDSKTF